MRYLAALALVFLATLDSRAQTPRTVTGTWTAELHNDRVYLQLRTAAPPDRGNGDWDGAWNMGQTMPVEDLAGLPANDERFTVSAIKLEMRREAGTLALEGAFREGQGAGLFSFTPRNDFPAEMKALGYTDDLPLWRRFQLAVHDIGPRYIRALKTEGYDKLSLDQIQRARTHGVTIDYIKAMKAEGYTISSIEELVRTRDHGVTAEYIQAMRKAGFKDVPIADLVRAKDHGINAEYVRALDANGFKNVPLDEAVRARDHRVSGDYIADMRNAGLKDLTLAELVRLRDHGVTAEFVKDVRARGLKEDTAGELIQLKNRGGWR